MVILHVVPGLRRGRGIFPHDVIVHDGGAPEEGEAAGRTQDTAQDVLSGLLQPVADGVLELLVPHHGACVGAGH